jgi:hypothetical protein
MGTVSKDLKGLQFGLLIVQREGEPQGKHHLPVWICRCICGVEKPFRYDTLQDGRAKSCGCATQRFRKTKLEKRHSLVNQRFGRLFVLWRVGSVKYGKTPSSHSLWECKCDCGKIVKVAGRYLRAGTKKSCGCLKRDMIYLMRELSKHGYLQSAMGAH